MHNLVTLVAKDFIVLSILILAFVWLRLSVKNKKQAVLIAVVATVITAVLALVGSKVFNDPRPFVAGNFMPYFAHGADNGFPSDHTLLAGLCAAIVGIYSKRFGAIALIIAASIGTARVIAGVHHEADIIGSLIFAGIGTVIAEQLVKRLARR
jgi:undecaprenyl-diphosphatase